MSSETSPQTLAAGARPLERRVVSGLGGVIAVGALFALPSYLGDYARDALVLFTISCLLMMGYRLITTMGGWSFAHLAVMGLGSYSMALMTGESVGLSLWLSLPVGGLVAGTFALLISYPVLRTRQHYFFLSTFAAGEALRQCYIEFTSITGGTYGISFIKRPPPLFGIDFSSSTGFYYLALTVTLVVGAALLVLDRSRLGNTIKAVAANEELSQSLGINVWKYRATAFVLGSFVAGVSGVLYGNFNGIISPLDFNSINMFKVVAAAIVGGTATFFGPIIGLLCLTLLEEVFRRYAEWIPFLWGGSVVLILLFLPAGLEDIAVRLFNRRNKVFKGGK